MSKKSALTGKVNQLSPNRIVITPNDDIDLSRISKLANGSVPQVRLEFVDNRKISPDQRGKIFALINDLCDYTGDLPEEWEKRFKWMTARTFNLPDYSLSDCSVTVGSYTILTILNFMFEEGIPFKTRTWDSIPDDYPKQRMAIMRRLCVICGKPGADLAHYQAIGRRSRSKVDHRKFWFMSLCRKHHTEQHTIGIREFIAKYHIKPVKLDGDDLVKLGIMTASRIKELDEEEKS